MSVYPRNMSAFLNRLSGYNKNNVKMNVLGSSTANNGDVIQVDLPTNSIVDLSSLAWSFKNTISVSTTVGDGDKQHDLPIQAESIINRLAVEVNGVTLVNLTNYNVLFHALLYMSATDDYQLQRKVAQCNTQTGAAGGRCQRIQTTDGGGNAATTTRQHVIDSWLGFLGSSKPNFIDTSLLGNVRITITLAGADMVGGDAAAGKANSYQLSDQYFSVDVVSIADGVYDAMVDQMLASGAPIEIPFKNYFSFSSAQNTSMSQTTAFNVASQSIDRLWAVPRAATYNARDAERVPTAPAHPIVADNVPYFNFAACNGSDFHFKVNNTMYPQWTSKNPQDWWQHTKLAVGDQGNMLAGAFPTALSHYLDNFFVYACQLEHRTDGDERFVSGIDTRGAAAQCYFISSQSTTAADLHSGAANLTTVVDRSGDVANQILVFAECTSSLRIMANKVLEIVQ
jgi:hypothetical protein